MGENIVMFNVAIIGCGNIAAKMAKTVNETEGCTLYAVASRDKKKAEEFASEFNASKSYSSYEDLFNDNGVDLVYVATITSLHHDHMIEALKHNKPVLCEKSFCVNRKEAEEVLKLAKEKNIFAAEAIWTRYMPYRKIINAIVDSGTLGKITSITANLGYTISNKERIKRPELGGGAMLDISVYPINFALMAIKDEEIVHKSGLCVKNEYGADIRETMDMLSKSGVAISLFADTETLSDRRGMIYLERGRIEVDNVNDPSLIEVFKFNNRDVIKIDSIELKHVSTGFEYELLEAKRAIESGKIEAESMSHEDTLNVLSIMDDFRKMYGVKIGSELSD